MSYTPINTPVYLHAFAGALAGLTSSATTDISPNDYVIYAQMADAYAQEVDIAAGGSTSVALTLLILQEISESVWSTRSPLPSPANTQPGSYQQVALSVLARVLAGLEVVSSEGINTNNANSSLARVVSPNLETLLPSSFSPTSSGKVVAVVDITPSAAGLMLTSINMAIVASAPDDATLIAFFVPNLTAITGGTLVAPGLTFAPTSTTPLYTDPSSVIMLSAVEPTEVVGGANIGTVSMANLPVQATPNKRCGIVFVAVSPNNTTWTSVAVSTAVVEQP
jgi:hypothetical protein